MSTKFVFFATLYFELGELVFLVFHAFMGDPNKQNAQRKLVFQDAI